MKSTPLFFFIILTFIFASCSNNHSGQLESTGTLESTDVNVSAKTSGQLQKLFFEEGSNVKLNDTLAILDHATFDLQLAQAEAGIQLAQSQYDLLSNGAREEDVRQAEEMLKQTETSLKNAKDDFERIMGLFTSNTVSKKQLDDAEARYTIAQTQYNASKHNNPKHSKTPQHNTIQNNTIQYTTLHYNTIQYIHTDINTHIYKYIYI